MKKTLSPTFYLRAQTKYGGKYIARKNNRVLASGKNLQDLLKVMARKKINHQGDVSIGYVPSANSLHVYFYC